MKKIDGVNITKIESHIDERGFFREILKKETSINNEKIII